MIDQLLYDVTHGVDIDNKYSITDRNGNQMTLWYDPHTHHGEPTIELGYIVPDGIETVLSVEKNELPLLKMYLIFNLINIQLRNFLNEK